MSKQEETVEVATKVPKRLMRILEEENYFGWKKEDFFIAAIKDCISCEVSEWNFDDSEKFYRKYGKGIDTVTVRIIKMIH